MAATPRRAAGRPVIGSNSLRPRRPIRGARSRPRRQGTRRSSRLRAEVVDTVRRVRLNRRAGTSRQTTRSRQAATHRLRRRQLADTSHRVRPGRQEVITRREDTARLVVIIRLRLRPADMFRRVRLSRRAIRLAGTGIIGNAAVGGTVIAIVRRRSILIPMADMTIRPIRTLTAMAKAIIRTALR
jgi:hypothetical protein